MKIGGGMSLSKKKKKTEHPMPNPQADIVKPFRILPDQLDFEAFAAAAAAAKKRDKEVRDEAGKKILQLRSSTPPIDIPPSNRAASPEVMALDARHEIEAWKRARIERNKEKFEKGLEEREVEGYSDDTVLDDKKKEEKFLELQEQLKNTHGSESLPPENVLDILKSAQPQGGKRRKKRTKRRKSKGKRKTKRRRKFRFKKKRTKRRKKSRKGRNTKRRRRR